jgi:hypothetical protein
MQQEVFLPQSIDEEIKYWQQYRAERITPRLKEKMKSSDALIFLSLLAKQLQFPIVVTGYSLNFFVPIPQTSELTKIVDENKPNVLKHLLHDYSHYIKFESDLDGKTIGLLLSSPLPVSDEMEISFKQGLENAYKKLQSEGVSYRYRFRAYNYVTAFANIIYNEADGTFTGYSPVGKLRVKFRDTRRNK